MTLSVDESMTLYSGAFTVNVKLWRQSFDMLSKLRTAERKRSSEISELHV